MPRYRREFLSLFFCHSFVIEKDRVTDHRIGLTLKNLTGIMEDGRLQEILDALKRNHDEELMEDMFNSA